MSSTVTSQTSSVHKSGSILGDSIPATAGGTLPESSTSTGTYLSAMNKSAVPGTATSSPTSGSSVPSTSSPQQRQILPARSSHSPPLVESAPLETKTNVSGLLNTKNLDEKIVAATLATLNSGTASSLIKQDLKWIIQSRRKAEGKSELQVEFKKPVKEEQLTSEEVSKRSRRRELNRLAARRSREKGQRRKDMLVEEIRKLQTHNTELMDALSNLTEQRNQIIDTLRQHMKQCSDYEATQKASVGLSHRVLSMLGVHTSDSDPLEPQAQQQLALSIPPMSVATAQQSPAAVADVSGMSALYISTSDLGTNPSKHVMSPGSFKTDLGSCHPSPHVLNLDKITKSPSYFQESKNEDISAESSVAGLDVHSSSETSHLETDYDVSNDSKIQLVLRSPGPNMQAQVFLVASSDLASHRLSARPSHQNYAVNKSTASSSIDSGNFSGATMDLEMDSRPKVWSSSSSPSVHVAVNNQVPISKEPLSLVPILPKPGRVHQRRNSIASLSASSEEGIATLLPHSVLIRSNPSPMQSAPSDSGLGSSQEEGGDGIGEEVVQYKHKLMKHRKQYSSDFTHPSCSSDMVGPGGRPSLLERSFSFPSSRSEDARSSSSEALKMQPPLVFTASTLPSSFQNSTSSSGFPQYSSSSKLNLGSSPPSLPTCVSSSIITDKFISEALPLDLPSSSLSSSEDHSALSLGSKTTSSIFKLQDTASRTHFSSDTAMDEDRSADSEGEIRGWASPMDTWPPAGSSRSALQFSRQERRWSVDDCAATPLNLSRHGSHDDIGSLDERSIRTALSRSSSPPALLPNIERKTLGLDIDQTSFTKW